MTTAQVEVAWHCEEEADDELQVLNETGFRKALKKFDKYTKVCSHIVRTIHPLMLLQNASRELYMAEKVGNTTGLNCI